jgi:hypothetical protein
MSDARTAKLAEVARHYKRKARKRRRARTAPQMAALRLSDLARLFRSRYGITFPDDDAGRDDLHVALSHIATLSNSKNRMQHYVEIWAPWLTIAEARCMIDRALTNPQIWKADQLAWRMRLTAADRNALGITTIGAIDLNKAGRTKARKVRARERQRANRRAKGAKPRAEYLASVKSRGSVRTIR